MKVAPIGSTTITQCEKDSPEASLLTTPFIKTLKCHVKKGDVTSLRRILEIFSNPNTPYMNNPNVKKLLSSFELFSERGTESRTEVVKVFEVLYKSKIFKGPNKENHVISCLNGNVTVNRSLVRILYPSLYLGYDIETPVNYELETVEEFKKFLTDPDYSLKNLNFNQFCKLYQFSNEYGISNLSKLCLESVKNYKESFNEHVSLDGIIKFERNMRACKVDETEVDKVTVQLLSSYLTKLSIAHHIESSTNCIYFPTESIPYYDQAASSDKRRDELSRLILKYVKGIVLNNESKDDNNLILARMELYPELFSNILIPFKSNNYQFLDLIQNLSKSIKMVTIDLRRYSRNYDGNKFSQQNMETMHALLARKVPFEIRTHESQDYYEQTIMHYDQIIELLRAGVKIVGCIQLIISNDKNSSGDFLAERNAIKLLTGKNTWVSHRNPVTITLLDI